MPSLQAHSRRWPSHTGQRTRGRYFGSRREGPAGQVPPDSQGRAADGRLRPIGQDLEPQRCGKPSNAVSGELIELSCIGCGSGFRLGFCTKGHEFDYPALPSVILFV